MAAKILVLNCCVYGCMIRICDGTSNWLGINVSQIKLEIVDASRIQTAEKIRRAS